MKKISFLSSNALKMIALVSMTLDHIGMLLFPRLSVFRILGRLALPIFAYMVGEGCVHTKSKAKYLMRLALLGVLIQIVYLLTQSDLFFNIFLTFSVSVLLCMAYDFTVKTVFLKSKALGVLFLSAVVFSAWMLTGGLNTLFRINVGFDGGAFGVFLPLAVYAVKDKRLKLAALCAVCVLMSVDLGRIQWFSLFAVVPLLFYNGERGRLKLKYFFYAYYPLHIALIYALSLLIKK